MFEYIYFGWVMNNNFNFFVKYEIVFINGVVMRIFSVMLMVEDFCFVVILGNLGGIGFYDIFILIIF